MRTVLMFGSAQLKMPAWEGQMSQLIADRVTMVLTVRFVKVAGLQTYSESAKNAKMLDLSMP